MPHRLRSILRELDVFVILGALLLVAAIFKASTFYNLSNLFTILELSAVLGIATLGEAMILIVRGVDVSVGAVMGLAGTLSAFLIPDFGLTVSILVPLLVCGLIGLGNGLLVEKGRVPPIVATIGMMWVVSGLAGGISNGRLRSSMNRSSKLPWAARSRLCRSSLSGSSSSAPSPISFDPTSPSADTCMRSVAMRAQLIIQQFRSRRFGSASMGSLAFSTGSPDC